MKIKEKIIQTTEQIYDLAREKRYSVNFSKRKINVITNRNTANTKKWRTKNR